MPENEKFKRLLTSWKFTGVSGLPQSVDAFYLSQWVTRLEYTKTEFDEEVEDTLLKATPQEEIKYLTYLVTKLSALAELLAKRPTATPTNLLAAIKAARPFKHTALFRQVTKALAVPGKSMATPPYDEEEIARPFQIEYVQAALLDVYLHVNEELQNRIAPSLPEPMLPADSAPIMLKTDMVDLLDLLEIMQERGDWKLKDRTSRKLLCQRIAALFELPASKKGAQSPDWKRFYDLMAARENDKSKTLTNRSKKGLYDAIKPSKVG